MAKPATNAGIIWANMGAWRVPRAVGADGVVSAESEAHAAELERALNAGEMRPAWWTVEDEEEANGKTDR